MTPGDVRQRSALRAAVIAPSLGLLTWGSLFPFLAQADVLRLSLTSWQLVGAYATQYLIMAMLAVAALPISAAFLYSAHRLGRRVGISSDVIVDWISKLLFFGITLFVGKTFLFGLLESLGLNTSSWPWPILIAAAAVSLATWAPSGFVSGTIGLTRTLAIAGIASIPFAFFAPYLPIVAGSPFVPARRPAILLVTLDALSARQMSLYGSPRSTTPRIDAFARTALVFEHAYAGANFTTAGINTLLTGRYPSQHRSMQLLSAPLAADRASSIPALLQRAGYYNGYVVSNPHAGPLRNGYGAAFDFGVGDAWEGRRSLCEDRLVEVLPYNCFVPNPIIDRLVATLTLFGRGNREYDPLHVAAGTRRFLATRPPRPFFLWVHYFTPHDPFAAMVPWIGRFDPGPEARDANSSIQYYGWNAAAQSPARTRVLEARYLESLAWADDSVSRLITDVEASSGPDLLVIITADHGESFSDGWGGHAGRLLNEDVIHIPLIVHLPGQEIGRRVRTIASQTDVRAIIAAILNGADADGVERLIDSRRSAEPALSMSFIDNSHLAAITLGTIAAISPKWKYVRYLGGFTTPQGRLGEQMVPLDKDSINGASARRILSAAVDRHMSRFAGPVDAIP